MDSANDIAKVESSEDDNGCDFQYYVNSARQNKMSWDVFVFLMKDLSSTWTRSKQLNSLLLDEMKLYKDQLKDLETQQKDNNIELPPTDEILESDGNTNDDVEEVAQFGNLLFYIQSARDDKMSWDVFVHLMKDMSTTWAKLKHLNLLLLKECKRYKNRKSTLENLLLDAPSIRIPEDDHALPDPVRQVQQRFNKDNQNGVAKVQGANPSANSNLEVRLIEVENKCKECDHRLKDLSQRIENQPTVTAEVVNTNQNTNKDSGQEQISQEISQNNPGNPIERNSDNNVDDNTMDHDYAFSPNPAPDSNSDVEDEKDVSTEEKVTVQVQNMENDSTQDSSIQILASTMPLAGTSTEELVPPLNIAKIYESRIMIQPGSPSPANATLPRLSSSSTDEDTSIPAPNLSSRSKALDSSPSSNNSAPEIPVHNNPESPREKWGVTPSKEPSKNCRLIRVVNLKTGCVEMKKTNFCEDPMPKKKVGRPPKKRIEHSPSGETRETTTPTKRARIQTSAEKSSPTLEKRLKPLITDPNQRFSCVILEDCSKRFKTVGDVEEHILIDHGELRACRLDINELLLSEYKASNEDRFQTFLDWPKRLEVSPEDLASAGFIFTGREDYVQCVVCAVIVDNWENGDSAMEEHKNAAPNCPFIIGFDQGIIVRPQNHNKFLCNYCDASFIEKKWLEVHIQRNHLHERLDRARVEQLPFGWTKKAERRPYGIHSGKWDVYVFTPAGEKLRSKPDLQKFLQENPMVKYDPDNTNFELPAASWSSIS